MKKTLLFVSLVTGISACRFGKKEEHAGTTYHDQDVNGTILVYTP